MSVTIDGIEYSWNQAICVACWNTRQRSSADVADLDRLVLPQAGDTRYVIGEVARCSYCGGGTTSGILVRDDPREVPFPQREAPDGGWPWEQGDDRAMLSVSGALVADIGQPANAQD